MNRALTGRYVPGTGALHRLHTGHRRRAVAPLDAAQQLPHFRECLEFFQKFRHGRVLSYGQDQKMWETGIAPRGKDRGV